MKIQQVKTTVLNLLKKIYKDKRYLAGIVAVVVIVVVIVLIVALKTPSAKAVFGDMQDVMLKTQSLTLGQTYAMTGTNGDLYSLKSVASMDMTSQTNLLAKGTFTLNLASSGTPISANADYLAIGSDKYVKFNTLSTTCATCTTNFQRAQSNFKDKWIKIRDIDNFATLADSPIGLLTSVLPTPFANLNDTQRQAVLAILRNSATYTINESSKVEINDVSAYKYSLSYSKDQYSKLESAIAGYVSYFKTSNSNDGDMTTLNLWVDIGTKRIIKMEFSGTSSGSTMEGTIIFSNYNKPVDVSKPGEYFIESELFN